MSTSQRDTSSIEHTGVFLSVIVKTIIAIFMALCGYIVAIIMSNVNMFITVFLVESVDFIFGIIIAYKKGKIRLKKGMNFLWTTISYWMILVVVLSIEKAHPAAYWVSEAIFLPIILFQLIAILKKASILKVIPQGLLLELLERIEYKKNETFNAVKDSITINSLEEDGTETT